MRRIVAAQGVRSPAPRSDRKEVEEQLLRTVYERCEGFVQRMHEVLHEEYGIVLGYSTLTRLVRQSGIGDKGGRRSERVPDTPGREMQHDTSVHHVCIDGLKTKLICSGLYLRYSKLRYVKYYRRFDRFTMKCFLHEALTFWGYCAHVCVIDNTCLAIWYGSGSRAVFAPEMVAFAKNYGFDWLAHEIGHANRKAGKERNFYTVETNFLPGRSFSTLADLNMQAKQWATDRYALRPQSGSGLVPQRLFESERPFLIKLPPYVSAPYRGHLRRIDQYGYVAFDGNFYWAPHTRATRLTVLEYADHIRMMHGTSQLLHYQLADARIKGQAFVPPGHNTRPRGQPQNRKKGCRQEESALRAMGGNLPGYLDWIADTRNGVKLRPRFVRSLYALSRNLSTELFVKLVDRALSFRVTEVDTIRNMAYQIVRDHMPSHTTIEPSYDYQHRDTYRQARLVEEHPLGMGLLEPPPPKEHDHG